MRISLSVEIIINGVFQFLSVSKYSRFKDNKLSIRYLANNYF